MEAAGGNPFYAQEMSRLQILRERLRVRLIQFRRRFIPYLVWHRDEVDVLVTFKEDRLRAVNIPEAMTDFHRGTLHAVKMQLNEIGIEFDTGLGPDGRDWEWDWSLRGPISVTFKRRAQKPELRQ